MCSTFRTVSDDLVFVMLGMVPTDILADEMSNINNIKDVYFIAGEKSRKGEIYNWMVTARKALERGVRDSGEYSTPSLL